MTRPVRLIALAASIMGMSALAITGTAITASAHNTPLTVSHAVSAADQQAALAYWTPARMKAATDISVAVATAPKVVKAKAHPDGKAGSVRGGAPAAAASVASVLKPAVSPDAFNYPYPYDSFSVPTSQYKSYPYALNGAIFFTNGGDNYVCSGTSVASFDSSTTENEVWTAGHCTASTESVGGFDTSAIFIPAYNGNATKFDPFGEFAAVNYITTTAWLNSRDLSVDMGAIEVGNSNGVKSNKKSLGNLVGYNGFAWNQAVDEQFVTFGYPAASPYNGTSMIEDIAATAVSDSGIGGSGSEPTGIGSPLTGGASGGSWNIDWAGGSGSGYINGHNDYKYSNQPLSIYSPYFTTLANQVRCFGATSC